MVKMGKNQHVTPHPQGGWQVKEAGNQRATVRTGTQAEARAIARNIAIHLLVSPSMWDSATRSTGNLKREV